MGTNYYLEEAPPCKCCGREYEKKHIGKGSWGWAFALHVYPQDGINDLNDWITYWDEKRIVNEEGFELTEKQMLEEITKRSNPNGLLRASKHEKFSCCIGHGEGTWDLCVGDFS